MRLRQNVVRVCLAEGKANEWVRERVSDSGKVGARVGGVAHRARWIECLLAFLPGGIDIDDTIVIMHPPCYLAPTRACTCRRAMMQTRYRVCFSSTKMHRYSHSPHDRSAPSPCNARAH